MTYSTKITLMSLFAAFLLALCAVSLISFNTPMEYELRIEQLPEKNPAANSNEVWIIALGEDVTPISTVKGELPAGWVQRENAVALVGENSPAFTWHARNITTHLVTLASHAWAGKARVGVNGIFNDYDLYSSRPTVLELNKLDFFTVFLDRTIHYFLIEFLLLFLIFLLIFFATQQRTFLWCFPAEKATLEKENFLITPVVVFILCLCTIISFYPGWLSPDSVAQYTQAESGHYDTWHPIMMAWWWSLLAYIKPGSGLFLIQNIIFYWMAFYFIAINLKKQISCNPFIILFFAVTPQCLLIMGQLWKDVVFSSSCLLSLSIVFLSYSTGIFTWKRRIFLLLLLTFSVGCKPNGIVTVCIIMAWWVINDPLLRTKKSRCATLALAGLFICVTPSFLSYSLGSKKVSPLQYIQSYDLLSMGIATDQVLLPAYITEQIGLTKENAHKFYFVGSNNLLFYETAAGNLTSLDASDIDELQTYWIHAIIKYPSKYFKTRYKLFMSLLRVNEPKPAFVVAIGSIPNPWGIMFTPNIITNFYGKSIDRWPWLFFPWIYLLLTAVSGILTPLMDKKIHQFNVVLTLCALSFTLPHFFITPANDYRYLHFSILCAMVQGTLLLNTFMFYFVRFIQRMKYTK